MTLSGWLVGEHCEFGAFLDEALRDRFVCGLRSTAIQKRLLAEAALPANSALETAMAMESASQQADVLKIQLPTQGNIDAMRKFQNANGNKWK